ncbi:MAG: hypothetical protein ACPL6D_07790, partial [Thermodesulfobacteriota bacterium]
MKQLRLFEEEREVQPQQRLATSCVVNSAFSEVTSWMEPEGARYQTATKVKVLSPEITIVSEVDALHLAEDSILTIVRRDGKSPTGSKSVVWYQMDSMGTRENQGIYQERPSKASGISRDKPIDGKELPNILWWSDCLI